MSLEDAFESQTLDAEESTTDTTSQFGSRFKEIKVSMAYEDGLSKVRCGLCKMYFHKSTVFCKVPNHRILELQTKWKCIKTGRRYKSASFLYNMTEVCLFCSQLFSEVPGEEKRLNSLNPDFNKQPEKEQKLEITTKLERSDLASGKRAYQSSEVDGRAAFMAISPPYNSLSKTRREADPWWEVDFGRPFHVHSIAFQISSAVRQKLYVTILILDKPLGFEDPFLDSARKSALLKRECTVNESDRIVMEPIVWELPANTKCVAVRVQLRGINFLGIQRFQAFQGDNLVSINDADLEKTANSYASLGPAEMKEALYEMMSPAKKKQLIRENVPVVEKQIDVHNYDMKGVNQLSTHIRHRYGTLGSWRERVTSHASIFPPDDVSALHRIIFKYVCDMNFSNKDHPPLDYDMMGAALILHFPRCDLGELHQRIRSTIRWIQTRTHLKQLGALLNSPNFTMVADNPNEHLYHLLAAFKRVEFYWNKLEEVEKAKSAERLHTQQLIGHKHDEVPQPSTVAEARGCSWSQFLLIMALFCTNQSHRIPELVFHIEDGKITATPVAVNTLSSPGGINDVSGGDSQMEPPVFVFSSSLDGGKSVMSGQSSSSPEKPGFAGGRNSQWLTRLSTAKILNGRQMHERQQSIQEKIGKVDYEFNSAFAEYKFDKFKKRVKRDPVYPKTLDLQFAKTLIPKRGMTITSSADFAAAAEAAAIAAAMEGGEEHSADLSSLHTAYKHHQGGITPVTPVNRERAKSAMRFPPLPLSRPNSHQDLLRPGSAARPGSAHHPSLPTSPQHRPSSPGLHSPPALTRSNTMTPGKLTRMNTMMKSSSMNLFASGGGLERPTTSASPEKPAPAPAPSHHAVSIASDDFSDDFSFSNSSKQDGEEGGHSDSPRRTANVDFYKVCALCELRLPKASMEIKVFRKHVVKLRSSWDPKLVSKEIRSLDNTISMYNLVDVCLFCSQYFDPDFPDGIAYPVKIAYTSKSAIAAVNAITSQEPGSSKFIPFYDMRHKNNDIDVGAMFRRPATVESRQRAKRATDIVEAHERKIANFLATSI